LQSPDRSPQDLKVIEDWVLERHYRSIQGVADDSGFGGTTMQYQVLLDPNKLFAYGVTVPQVTQQLATTMPMPAAASIRRAASSTTSAAWDWCATRGHRQHRSAGEERHSGLRQRHGQGEIGHAPRLGQFGYMKQDEAVEGVILMRVGEQAQVILKRVEAMTKDLNEHVLPPDVKVVPYYDRQGLIEETTKTVEATCCAACCWCW
jgi:cobalt-zinc-cadmium resistance protein CzcA